MHIELVTIGNELLLGFTVDTNGAEIARALSSLGVDVVRRTAVPDRAESIAAAVAESLRRTGAVLTTGGLGPTRDDISKTVVAELYGAPLEFDQTVWSDIVARFVAEECSVTPHGQARSSELYARWQRWGAEEADGPDAVVLSAKALGQALGAKGFRDGRDRQRGRFRVGLMLKPEQRDDA